MARFSYTGFMSKDFDPHRLDVHRFAEEAGELHGSDALGKFGRLAGVVKFLSDDPQSTRAWSTGSVGEQKLAERLAKGVGDRAVVLHDRKEALEPLSAWLVQLSQSWQGQLESFKGYAELRTRP